MGYASLRQCVDDLRVRGHLIDLDVEIDPYLEAAEIQRRVYQAGGPAIFFRRVKGTRFPMVSNLFGTTERAHFIFRDSLQVVRHLVHIKADPGLLFRKPWLLFKILPGLLHMLPNRRRRGPVLDTSVALSALPQLVSWPDDGGAFVTLPQVYSEDPRRPGWIGSNLGMYRVQMSGGQYLQNLEVGLHYQLHRGLGVHHTAALERGEPLKVNVFVGGPPAMTLAAVMPLPEGLPELAFAGVLGGRRVRLVKQNHGPHIHGDADFCISGTVQLNRRLPEGPFGDHLGYYAKTHNFPVLQVENVWARKDAIWPFTSVGRPPQEDTVFGELIHEITGPLIPTVLPGVSAVNAVDAAGVHPLLLVLGSERYTPDTPRERPQELLTQANAVLGQGQMSLAKYLLIAAQQDAPGLQIHDEGAFLKHVLERMNPMRDLHFQTQTTMDTLDYSGDGLNQGSKLVIAAVGPAVRQLATSISGDLRLPEGFGDPQIALPGVLCVKAPSWSAEGDGSLRQFCQGYRAGDGINRFTWVVLVDDSGFCAQRLGNFLWVTFTRSNPAVDVDGIEAFVQHKHWGCRGSLVIDARSKPHHAPALIEDPEVTRRVDQLAAPGGPLHRII